ncbi:MAG: DUF1007 family protein [Proteobacteria bacterium]|nr:DUF1007 family protein [Pseudomonadota bacterium]
MSFVVGLAILASWPQMAAAHPHVFIDNQLAVLFAADGKVAGFRTAWTFDDIFTEDLLNQFDADGDKQFSASESEQVKDGTLPNLAAFHYFTYIYENGKDLGEMAPTTFKADIVDGRARFQLTYKLPDAVDPRQSPVALSVYDQEYYVEVLLAEKNPVTIEGNAAGCAAEIADDQDHAYFGGFVVPQLVSVKCP